MAKFEARTQRPARRSDVRWLATAGVFLIVVVELLSLVPSGPLAISHSGPAAKRSPAGDRGSEMVAAASTSLGRGAGPAGGVPWGCPATAGASAVQCGPSSGSTASLSMTPTTPSWSEVAPPTPSGRTNGAMVYDAKDGYVLLFGGLNSGTGIQDTWKFSVGAWTPLHPSTAPSARGGAAIAFDAADNYVVLFGGVTGSTYLSDTWKFSGGAWTLLSPTSHPSARAFATMSYDTKDGYAVLFGGTVALSTGLFDTWKFSAGQWTALTPATHPAGRSQAAMAYDSADAYVVLFGGDNTTVLSDTWNFSGGVWTQLTPIAHPGVRYQAGLANSGKDGKLLLFGGSNGVGRLSDAWTFVGGTWTKISSSVHPTSRSAPMVADGPATGTVVLFGGLSIASALLNDTWTFHGLVWARAVPHTPPPRAFATMTYDEADGYVLLFGGSGLTNVVFGDTWKYVHGTWTQLHPAHSPPALQLATMAYDQADGYVVLFGGANTNTPSDSSATWTFLGGNWNSNVTATGPVARYGAAMTFDAADGYLLMFGGENLTNFIFSDTWAFRGGLWWDPLASLSATSPDPRGGSAMAYDSEDGYVVLFGGTTGGLTQAPATTWTYTGGAWTNITSTLSTQPVPGAAFGFVDDTFDGYMLLYGGFQSTPTFENQTWEFLGGTWTQLSPAANPGPRGLTSMAFYPNDNVAVLYGGDNASGLTSGTWTY